MTKESLYTPETRRLLFRGTFNDEQSVRKNNIVPNNIVFQNGVGIFNGSNASGVLNKNIKGIVTVRIVLNSLANIANGKYLIDFRANGGSGYILLNSTTTFAAVAGGTSYVDGVATNTVSTSTKEIVVSGITIDNNSGTIGRFNGGGSGWLTAGIDLIEIYNYTLTAEEVSNIYEKRRFRDLELREEKLGAVQNVSDCENSPGFPYSTFTGVSPTGFSAVTAASGQCGTADEIAWVNGSKYKITFDLVLNSGALPTLRGCMSIDGSCFAGWPVAVDGANEHIFSPTSTYTGVFRFASYAASDYVVSNLKVQKIEVEDTSEILNISAQSGSIIDRQKNVLTLTSMSVFKDGDIRAMLFDGTDSKVDCGDIVFYTFDTTFICWMKPYSLGESEGGRLFDNGKLIIYIRTATNYISIFTNSTLKSSSPNAFIFNKWHLFVVTVTVLGIVNIYMNGILSGAADQDCGATVVGTTNLFIGNNDVGNSTFDGPLNDSRIHKGILTAQEISQLFSNERIKYQV